MCILLLLGHTGCQSIQSKFLSRRILIYPIILMQTILRKSDGERDEFALLIGPSLYLNVWTDGCMDAGLSNILSALLVSLQLR